MRIALVSDTFTPQVNGVTTVVCRMVEAIRAAGHDLALLTPRYPGEAEASVNGQLRIASVPFPVYPDIRLSVPPYRGARRFLCDFEPDLVHVTTEGPLGFVGRRWALRNRIPLVTSLHTDYPRYARDYRMAPLEPLVWRTLLWFHGPARLTHTPGEAMLEKLHARGLTHAVLWGRGIDTARFHPGKRNPQWRRRHGISEDACVVLHVGRLAREKNLDVLLGAWSIVRERLGDDAEFVIAGGGPLAEQLASKAPWTRRLGFLGHEELAEVYANADICVLPSATETCGLVAPEAMASGLPVVAADAGGFRDSVEPGVNGRLVPHEDPGEFADAIIRLAEDHVLRGELARGARRTAEARDMRLENEVLLEQYREVATLLRSGSSRPGD